MHTNMLAKAVWGTAGQEAALQCVLMAGGHQFQSGGCLDPDGGRGETALRSAYPEIGTLTGGQSHVGERASAQPGRVC
jgi:hypothetical protein